MIIIGLIGNPNTGKSTLFNQLTGSRQRVGNWAGVTVDKKEGYFSTTQHKKITLVDLPGTYSLTALSEQTAIDEQITCRYMLSSQINLAVNVIDSVNLERNLYLTLQLIELDIPCIIALNMLDIAKRQHIKIDINQLSKQLDCPVIPLISCRARGIEELKNKIDDFLIHKRKKTKNKILVNYSPELLEEINKLAQAMPESISIQKRQGLALQILEGNIHAVSYTNIPYSTLINAHKRLVQYEDLGLLIADARYQSIERIFLKVDLSEKAEPHRLTQKIDSIILNRWLGIPIFLLIMYLIFILAINIGGAFQPIFDIGSSAIFIQGFQWIGYTFHFPSWLTTLLTQGVGSGINTILPLVPQIGIVYLLLSFLENSGYMARVAFVMDRLMQALGLPGKSFVPLIVGFGCNVPAIIGTRTLDSAQERFITIMMAPFMSCGARLAIFVVFTMTFFNQRGASIVFSLYLLGILAAIATGLILKYTIIRGEITPFFMELPVYHIPHIKSLFLQTWQRLKAFIVKAGKVIIASCILIGGLNSFSFNGQRVDKINDSALASISKTLTPLLVPIGINPDNWQAIVSLISGALAKEVVIGTLNAVYTAEKINNESFDPKSFNLLAQLKEGVYETINELKDTFRLQVLFHPLEGIKSDGKKMSSIAISAMSSKFGSSISAYSYLIFVLLYIPCVSVMSVISRETSRSWMIFSVLWGLDLAYSLATLFYQIATFNHHPQKSLMIVCIVIMINGLFFLGLRYRSNI